MIDDYEDVPGAAAAARATVAREYAFQRIAAQLDDGQDAGLPKVDPKSVRNVNLRQVERGAQNAGLTLYELDAAELELRRIYLNESGRDYLLSVARQHLTLLQMPEPDGPDEDSEDYRHSDGTGLK